MLTAHNGSGVHNWGVPNPHLGTKRVLTCYIPTGNRKEGKPDNLLLIRNYPLYISSKKRKREKEKRKEKKKFKCGIGNPGPTLGFVKEGYTRRLKGGQLIRP